MGHSYRDLIVWRKAIEMVTHVYCETQKFSRQETYGLIMPLRRSAVSVPSNIAEGQGRLSRGEFRQFLGHARGSLLEMETQLLIAKNRGYISSERMNELMKHSGEVSRLLHGLMQSISQSDSAGTRN